MANNSTIIHLISCGILKKEIDFLIKKNNWPIDTTYLSSELHMDYAQLLTALESQLSKRTDNDTIVCYGSCHPLIENIISGSRALRVNSQNCVEMLLGKEDFFSALSQGAFFLMEQWTASWEDIIRKAFGDDMETIKMIFQSEHTHFLGLKTPCSGDFSKKAEKISSTYELPLIWKEVDLIHFENLLQQTIQLI